MYGFATINQSIGIFSIPSMQKFSYIEALAVVAIISAVGYGTVVIQAMTGPR